MVEIADKDFKAAIKIMLQWALINMFETDDKVEKLSRDTESLSKERECIKKRIKQILELKNSMNGFNRVEGGRGMNQ